MSRAKVWRFANAVRKQKVLRFQTSPFDPTLQRLARCGCDFELHGTLRLLLPYDGSGGNAITMTDIMDAQAHKVAGAQFAIDAEVKEGKLAHSFLHLQTNADGPDVLELEGRFLANELSLVPRFAAWSRVHGFHGVSPFG